MVRNQPKVSEAELKLMELSNQWMDAWKRRDSVTLANILADDFILTSSLSNGELIDKQQWLDKALHHYECRSFSYDRMKVRLYGNTAVVNSWYRQQATADGQDWSWEFLITDIWVNKNGCWQVVARHASRLIRAETETKN